MSEPEKLRLGVIGTSWWVDAMYLPALATLDFVDVVAIAGRDPDRARERAEAWGVPAVYTDWLEMIDSEHLHGVIVAAANPVHEPATRAALERNLHVLCEKPVAATYAGSAALADLAREQGAITLVPFTYAYMPGFRFLEHLVHDGFAGTVHTIGLRYHAGYGIDAGYEWKFDARANPTGALGDIGSHFIYLAQRLGGSIEAVTARLDTVAEHVPEDEHGGRYPLAADTAAVILEFSSGAQGILHASAVAYEGTSMNQRHVIEVHGSGGTLRYEVDWDEVQTVSGTRVGEGPVRPLPIPDEFWQGVRRERVHDTYRDVFRTTNAMARGWVEAISRSQTVHPDIADGAEVQRILDACLLSSQEGRRVESRELGSPV